LKFLLFFLGILCLSSCDKATSVLNNENPASSQTDSIPISEKYYQEGIKFYENGDLEKAKNAYREAIDRCNSNKSSDYFQYYISLIGIHRMKDEYGDALALLKEYEEKDLKPVEEHILTIINIEQYLYLASGQYNEALKSNEEYYNLLKNNKNSCSIITALILKSDILFKLGRLEEANKILDDLKKRNDLDFGQQQGLFIKIGIQKFYQGNFKDAIDYYKRSLNLNKKIDQDGKYNAVAIDYANIAEAYIELEDYEQARVYLDSFKSIKQEKVENDIRVSVFKYELRLARALQISNERIEDLIDKTQKDQDLFYQNRFTKDLELLVDEKQKSEQLLKEKQQTEIEKLNFRNKVLFIGSILIIGLLGILFFTFKQKRDHEIANLKIHQRLLRAQMNPHFIFNVLSSIQNLVRNDAKSAARFITKFSRLLRTVLENSMENYVPLEDEIMVLKNYLDLQKLRFPELFDYQLLLYEGIDDSTIKIPPMLIQPFVENAIEHGFKGIESRGWIEIQLSNNSSKLGKVLLCKIMDNGTGYAIKKDSSKKSASVKLISNFIKKATGSELSISFLDQENSTGTVVEFQIPTN